MAIAPAHKHRPYLIEDEDATQPTVKPGGSRVTSQVDFSENLAVKEYGTTSNTVSCDALMTDSHTLMLCHDVFFTTFCCCISSL